MSTDDLDEYLTIGFKVALIAFLTVMCIGLVMFLIKEFLS